MLSLLKRPSKSKLYLKMPLFHNRQKEKTPAARLYDAVMARARSAIFHTAFAVPDTIDGRFDLLTMHAYLVMEALKDREPPGKDLATDLASLIFAGFEEALRELGVTDFGVPKRMRSFGDAFYGRLEAYSAANSQGMVAEVLLRNVFRGEPARRLEAAALAHYVEAVRLRLRASSDALLEGRADFGPLPEKSEPSE